MRRLAELHESNPMNKSGNSLPYISIALVGLTEFVKDTIFTRFDAFFSHLSTYFKNIK